MLAGSRRAPRRTSRGAYPIGGQEGRPQRTGLSFRRGASRSWGGLGKPAGEGAAHAEEFDDALTF